MSEDHTGKEERGPRDNFVKTFQLEETNLRGRVVKLGSVLSDIIETHNYPKPVAHLVAESATLALLLSSMLKYEGIFTLQTSGDGPIGMIVSDVTSAGEVRACASFDGDRVEKARAQLEALKTPESGQNQLAQYLGKGYIAFTVDQGAETERYQGIVELKGASLIDCVQHYFAQSEQIGTGIKMAAGLREGHWRGGGIMLQRMPEEGGEKISNSIEWDEDGWRRSMILLDTCTEDEMLDGGLTVDELLTRLFHEEGVRVFEPQKITKGCRCDLERVEGILCRMPADDREYMAVEGKITMHCEFCSYDFVFDAAELERKIKASAKSRN